jgi:trehalose 6-phosphate phosphatase
MNIAEDTKRPDAPASIPELLSPADRQNWALFLDVDGTLLDFAPRPDAVIIPPDLPELLVQLHRAFGGALAMVTGREIKVIDSMFDPLKLPVAGVHGAELRLSDGTLKGVPVSPALPRIVEKLDAFAAVNEGLLVEKKGRAVAMHYRLNPTMGEDVEAFVRDVVESDGEGLEIQPGKMVVEVRPAKIDKGRAIGVFLEDEPFVGRTPLVIGDDWTDEPAFRTANARDGRSIRVGRDKRPTEANESIADPTMVRQWLALLLHS